MIFVARLGGWRKAVGVGHRLGGVDLGGGVFFFFFFVQKKGKKKKEEREVEQWES